MKELEIINLIDLDRQKTIYLAVIEPYNTTGYTLFKGSGCEIIKKLKSVFNYYEWLYERQSKDKEVSLELFLEYCTRLNGDGLDYIEVFKLN